MEVHVAKSGYGIIADSLDAVNTGMTDGPEPTKSYGDSLILTTNRIILVTPIRPAGVEILYTTHSMAEDDCCWFMADIWAIGKRPPTVVENTNQLE